MRKFILAAALVLAAISRPAAADDMMEAYAKAVPISSLCAFFKYGVDRDALISAASDYADALSKRDPADAEAGMILLKSEAADVIDDTHQISAGGADTEEMMTNFDEVFQRRNAQCAALSRSGLFSTYIQPSQFLLSGQQQTSVNWIEYYADAGDSFAMLEMGNLYIAGLGGLPKDMHMGMTWMEKAVDAGNAQLAPIMQNVCDAHIRGVELPKDRVVAAKWCYLARTLRPSLLTEVAPLESQLTPAERAAGQKLGDAWLAAHPAAQSAQ